MNFWKNHAALRGFLIALFFVLGLMLVGVVFLLAALFVYNAAYKN